MSTFSEEGEELPHLPSETSRGSSVSTGLQVRYTQEGRRGGIVNCGAFMSGLLFAQSVKIVLTDNYHPGYLCS